MTYILNALPGACLPSQGGNLGLTPISWDQFRIFAQEVGAQSAVGHKDTASLVSSLAGFEVPFQRVSVPEFQEGDRHLLALYRGPRLPEGATMLPEGATLTPFLLEVGA